MKIPTYSPWPFYFHGFHQLLFTHNQAPLRFTPKPISFLLHHIVSAPLRPWGKSGWMSLRFGCSPKRSASHRYPSCLQLQWLPEHQKPWQGLQMCFSCLAGKLVRDARSRGFHGINCSKLRTLLSCPTSLLSL